MLTGMAPSGHAHAPMAEVPESHAPEAQVPEPQSPEAEAWSRQARALLRRAGHSRGAARDTLIELFADQDCASSVSEVEELLESRQRPVGRASIYRALEVLSDLGLLVRVDVGDGVARYERAHDHGGEHHHHHLICDTCGLLIPFDDDELERAIDAPVSGSASTPRSTT